MKFDQDLCLNLQYDFGKMNSTLGSVVPLAMFNLIREESRDESIAWRHLFPFNGNNDDKSETIDIMRREQR